MLRWMMLAVLFVALPAAAKGGRADHDLGPEDQKAIHDYKLTNATIDKLVAAGPRLRALIEKDPAMAKFRPLEDAKTIDEGVKRMQRFPQGVAALKSAGLSPREFLVGTYTLMTAAMWTTMKKSYPQAQAPEYVNPDNMKFVDAHPEALKKFQDAWGTAEGKER